MNTSFLTRLMRLGAEVFGSNEDLSMLPRESDKPGNGGDSDGDDDSDDTSDESQPGEGDTDGDTDGDDSDSEGGGNGDSDEDSDDEAKGKSGDEDDSDEDGDDTDSDSDSDDADGDDDSDDSDDSDSDAPDNTDTDKTDDSESGDQPTDTDGGKTAGGHHDAGEFAEALIDGLKTPDAHILDGSDALQQATDKCRDDDDCQSGEQVWRPYDPEQDLVAKPNGDRTMAEAMRKEAAVICAAFRTQFRRRFLQAKNPRVQHGVKRGKDLSERRLVESFIEIKAGVRPSRPDYKVEAEQDVSLALGVVIDESGSMCGHEQHAAAVSAIALAESFDSLNAPVMVCGPRNGGRGVRGGRSTWSDDYYAEDSHQGETERCVETTVTYHRHDKVVIDLFKDWHESFKAVKHRFASVQATGSTPLSDGIQFAMQELNRRPERHRIIVVLTDGCPDNSAVVKRQIRLAKEAGITIIGVGISGAEHYLPGLFVDHHIVVDDLNMLPKRMMEVVGAIVFPRSARKAALDGKIGNDRQRRRA